MYSRSYVSFSGEPLLISLSISIRCIVLRIPAIKNGTAMKTHAKTQVRAPAFPVSWYSLKESTPNHITEVQIEKLTAIFVELRINSFNSLCDTE